MRHYAMAKREIFMTSMAKTDSEMAAAVAAAVWEISLTYLAWVAAKAVLLRRNKSSPSVK